jgi:hypothetical protein
MNGSTKGPVFASYEFIYVLHSGLQKIKKIDVPKFARLANAEQN